MRNRLVIMKIILPLLICCILLPACNRPMPQPPVTQSLQNPLLKVMNTGTTAPTVQASTATRTAQASSTSITPNYTPSPSPTNSPTHGLTQIPKSTSTPFPTPVWCPVEPAPSTNPGKLRLVYASRGALWLWNEAQSAVQLTQPGNIDQVSLSDDGQIIAFTRKLDEYHVELWAINADGSHELRLISADGFTQLDGSTDALGVLPYMLKWEPGSHHLTFYTYPLYDALMVFEPSSPWLINLDTGDISSAPYNGGNTEYSPDGKYVIIFDILQISLVRMDGSDLREDILPGYHGIAQGEQYYDPQPYWANDSSSFTVALPNQDDLYTQDSTVTVWNLPVEGKPTELGQWKAFAPSVTFSPDNVYMAYWNLPEGSTNQRELHLARLEGSGASNPKDAIYTRGELIGNVSWSTDSQHFIFTMVSSGSKYRTYLGNTCQRSTLLMEGDRWITAAWVDASRYLLASNIYNIPGQGELRLGEIGQEQTELIGVVTAYDWAILP